MYIINSFKNCFKLFNHIHFTSFLRQCRPFAIGVANAIKQIKQVILYLSNDITETEVFIQKQNHFNFKPS